ncbi:MAG: hypothetical protein V3T22_10035 [Planctomycetota bacterium]
MRNWLLTLIPAMALMLTPILAGAADFGAPAQEPRFTHVDLYVDSGDAPLHAWQVRLSDPSGRAKVVGVEGGQDPAWQHPPYHDPQALQRGEIVLAAYSLEGGPSGRQRVARVHLAIDGAADVDFLLVLQTAASAEGALPGARATIAR